MGSGVYTYELLNSFYDFDEKNEYTVFLPPNVIPSDLPKEKNNWHYQLVGPAKLWTMYSLPKFFFVSKPKLDIFFSPTHYLPPFILYPSAISILDLSFLYFKSNFTLKDFWQLKLWSEWSAKSCRQIFTISQASKDDIINLYQLPENKIAVTYPGIKELKNLRIKELSMNKVLEKYGINHNYILFVGTVQPRKNIVKLIEAFSKITDKDLELVIIGRSGWMYEEIYAAPKKFGVEQKVKFLDSVSDEELPYFYKNAACFVLPSLYEGFGMPILEAMQNGCPVVTSNVSSMPEAGGNAALYVDPSNVGDILNKIKMVISDPKLQKEMIKKGYEQVKKFSWEKTARETLKVLEQVAGK
ncbi:glycosyltransferase family 4 protein [Candidatus Gottesmanbacteria bacterium]|nr:glycosyltransferase family 4 protein [Candidatus Gottesmanbacteria bacterium]